MKILFCNIAQMKYYKGIVKNIDEPHFGGEYILRTGDAYEKFNFDPVKKNDEQEEMCLGYVETKSTNGVSSNQLHIERIEGVLKSDDFAEEVLVVWCAKLYANRTVIVGWYNSATVFRNYKKVEFERGYVQDYNVVAFAEDCVLLPSQMRNDRKWYVPRQKDTHSFGFGQANVWFASEKSAQKYVNDLVRVIENYTGENWLRKDPE